MFTNNYYEIKFILSISDIISDLEISYANAVCSAPSTLAFLLLLRRVLSPTFHIFTYLDLPTFRRDILSHFYLQLPISM